MTMVPNNSMNTTRFANTPPAGDARAVRRFLNHHPREMQFGLLHLCGWNDMLQQSYDQEMNSLESDEKERTDLTLA